MDSLLELIRSRRAELEVAAALERDDEEAQRLEGSFIDFVEAAWPALDPAEYQPCWAIDALCEHLQAVSEGQIPPSFGELPTAVRQDDNYIDMLPSVDVGAVCADVSEGAAGAFPVWVVQPRSIVDEFQFDTAAHSEPVVPVVVGASFQLSRRPEHKDKI